MKLPDSKGEGYWCLRPDAKLVEFRAQVNKRLKVLTEKVSVHRNFAKSKFKYMYRMLKRLSD